MQALDPNRPHGLTDVIERMNTERGDPSWLPSWADICRVREYVGESWSRARQRIGNDYSLAWSVLVHLEFVEKARATIAPYTTITCVLHDAPIGAPCGHHQGSGFVSLRGSSVQLEEEDTVLPETPVVCTWRVLAKHNRLAATEIFERRALAPAPQASGRRREVLPLSADLEGGKAVVRVQYRHPQQLAAERLFIALGDDWSVHDIRVGGTSVLAPHLDLPGFLFSADVMGPHLPLPVVDQDQWIEVEARRIRGTTPRFYASLVGSRNKGE